MNKNVKALDPSESTHPMLNSRNCNDHQIKPGILRFYPDFPELEPVVYDEDGNLTLAGARGKVRRVLLLQGPVGPFFPELHTALAASGFSVPLHQPSGSLRRHHACVVRGWRGAAISWMVSGIPRTDIPKCMLDLVCGWYWRTRSMPVRPPGERGRASRTDADDAALQRHVAANKTIRGLFFPFGSL